MFRIDEASVITQFLDFMRNSGIEPHGDIEINPDGKIHRFCVEGDRAGSKNGAYCLHLDGYPAGFVQNWRTDVKAIFKYSFTDDEKREYLKGNNLSSIRQRQIAHTGLSFTVKANAKRENMQGQKKEDTHQAILSAWREYSYPNSTEFATHPYLRHKHIENGHHIFFNGGHMLKVKTTFIKNSDFCRKGDLLIPLVSSTTGVFTGLQKIQHFGDFSKFFYKGTNLRGCCCELIPFVCRAYHNPDPLGNTPSRCSVIEADELHICEGLATGFSVLELKDNSVPVICAMSADNIIYVAKAWRERYPKMNIIIDADNDTHGKGQRAAENAFNAGYADDIKIPPAIGDWNDYLNSQKGF